MKQDDKSNVIRGVYMPADLSNYAFSKASEDGRSFSAWIRRLIESHRKQYGNAPKGAGHAEPPSQPA